MAKHRTKEDDALLAELGVEAKAEKVASFSRIEERVIAGFEEIQHFYKEHDRLPESGDDRDIFERMYAIRLERIAGSEEYRKLLTEFDEEGLLDMVESDGSQSMDEEMTDGELLAALGTGKENSSNISNLKHVREFKERAEGEEHARRTRCTDFEKFQEVFEKVQSRFDSGEQETTKYQQSNRYSNDIELGDMFILEGQKAIVAGMSEAFTTGTKRSRNDSRLRVVFDNGTESNLLLRSLQKSLTKDINSRRILTPEGLPLFAASDKSDEIIAGYIYVLRSLSEDPFISKYRDVIHKIGMTTGDIKKRISNAKKDPTYLLSDVELVGNFRLININPKKLERLLHMFFSPAKLNVQLEDRFGIKVEPKEWFLLPVKDIQTAIELIGEGQIQHYKYDPKESQIVDVRTDEPYQSP
ncbi:MAG: GIY-YIG nuclease family protein [Planctomycetes bacterium]|nr:GIY-YIG nuclease family protein [Planctomycetota bacterium]